jgi:hypothetical protein
LVRFRCRRKYLEKRRVVVFLKWILVIVRKISFRGQIDSLGLRAQWYWEGDNKDNDLLERRYSIWATIVYKYIEKRGTFGGDQKKRERERDGDWFSGLCIEMIVDSKIFVW